MIWLRLTVILAVLNCFAATALSQESVSGDDRILAGPTNLGFPHKVSGSSAVQNELRKVLANSRVNAIIIQERIVGAKANAPQVKEHQVLYAIGRETKFRTLKISDQEYKWLIEQADQLDSEQ